MIFKSYLLLISYFLAQNPVTAIDRMNLHDMNSIEIFINNVRERAWSHYHVENRRLSSDEKKNILKIIFYDLTKILTEFNNMSVDSRKVFSSGGLVSFISSLEEHGPKNGYFLQPKLSDKLTKIFNISETINSYVEPLLQLGANNISDDQNVLQYCPFGANAKQDFQFKYERQIILKEYKEFIEVLMVKINKDKWSNICGQRTSLNQAVFDYYHHLIATYLKEYVILYYIDIIDARCLNLNAVPLLVIRQNDSLAELEEIVKLTKALLTTPNYSIHNCDANHGNYINGNTYYELEHMFETMIIAEKVLHTKKECFHNCNLHSIRYNINRDQCQDYVSCEYIGDTINFCKVSDPENSRLYQWFESDGAVYGSGYPDCNGTINSVSSYYSWWPPFSFCDYCVCTCRKKPQSLFRTTPAISFREQVTDIDNNMVVVGVRFIEKNDLIHVQIKERKLRPTSWKDKASWKKLEDIHHLRGKGLYYETFKNSSSSLLERGVDYEQADMMNLDDLIAPQGCVVTGVRFRTAELFLDKVNFFKTGKIQLQIRVTPFDYSQGVLNKNESFWIIKPDYYLKRLLPLDEPDNPTKSPGNKIDSSSDQYVKFQSSDLIKDGGQSTVPFFDAQDVEGKPEFPLGGVGIVHRGREGYGGFLAFKIYDLNLSGYFNDKSKPLL